MNEVLEELEEHEPQEHELDPVASILFLVFIAALGYLVIANSFGIYPWIIVDNIIFFIPTWEAVITFISILIIMFVTLLGGLVRMRYSIYLVGFVMLVGVFVITFYALFLYTVMIGLP